MSFALKIICALFGKIEKNRAYLLLENFELSQYLNPCLFVQIHAFTSRTALMNSPQRRRALISLNKNTRWRLCFLTSITALVNPTQRRTALLSLNKLRRCSLWFLSMMRKWTPTSPETQQLQNCLLLHLPFPFHSLFETIMLRENWPRTLSRRR